MLTTHVLDTALGRPASGVGVACYALAADGSRTALATAVTDDDGRTGSPIVDDLRPGRFELVFAAGDYLAAAHPAGAFYADIPIRFEVRAAEHHHVPLLLSPFGYSTYRGS